MYFYLAELTRGLTLELPKIPSVHQQEQENCENWLVVADWGIAVTLHPQPPTLQWPLLFRRRPASSTHSSPACRCVWQRRGWCGGSWSPWQCPADGQRRRSYYSDPELTLWCTILDTGMTGKEAKWEVYQNPPLQLQYNQSSCFSIHPSVHQMIHSAIHKTTQHRYLSSQLVSQLTLSVNTTPIFQTWYFASIELNLATKIRWYEGLRFSIWPPFLLQAVLACLSFISPWHQWSLLGDSFLCGVEIQGTLVQSQQLCYPLCSIQVSVLFNHLQTAAKQKDLWRWHRTWHLANITR